jgi:hypothetical protein
MTLVLACAQRTRVLQVSDRRLTRIHPITRARTTVQEPATKSVVFENRALFGYTGLSILERKRTDLWIAETIAQVTDGDVVKAIDLLRADLDRAFRRSLVPDPVPYQAIVVSGFRPVTPAGFQAFNALIANSPDERSPARTFKIEVYEPPKGSMAITQAPRWLTESEFNALSRSLRRAGEGGATFVTGIKLLGEAIRGVSRRHMEVGSDLIVASLPVPRNLTLGESYIGRGAPAGPGATFEYLSEAGSSVSFAPTSVLNGMIFRDVVEGHETG